MKVFLSWSGEESRQLADIFKDWLPSVLQYVEPYMSAKDIDLGERWNNSITSNLEESVFGLIFVTPTNINAPWLNYEAGALSKTFDSKVVPILYKSDVTMLNKGPLRHFQASKDLKKENVLELLKSINISDKKNNLSDSRVESSFEMWWPKLQEKLNSIVPEKNDKSSSEEAPSDQELLKVIFNKLERQEDLLRDFNTPKRRNSENIVTKNKRIPSGLIAALEDAFMVFSKYRNELVNGPYEESQLFAYEKALKNLNNATEFLSEYKNLN